MTSTEPTTDAGLAPEDVAVETIDTPTAASVQAQDVTFADFDVRPEIVAALADAGITAPFPIQAMTLPVALSGHDIIGQAKTGTGKTLGFGVPLLHRVVAPDEEGFDTLPAPGKPQALVVVPTRELAVQVAGDLETASKRRSVRIALLYGGRAYEPQIEMLQRGVEVVVGTPGRMIDLMNQGHLDLTRVRCVVLDEADEMLDLGFLPDVEKLLARTPASRHTMLFSATMPGAVVAMARRYMTQPTHIRASEPDDVGKTVKNIKQVVYRAHALDKVEVLARLLQAEGRGLTIVFARTKRTAAKVADELIERGFAAGALHGDLGQGAREQALRAFRNGKVDVLVATDVAARGIDVDDVTHVVNYQCPEDEKTYLHRTGRTGRAGHKGTAVTFVDWDDLPRWSLIDKALELGFPEPQETYSSSPHLYTDLGIPEGTTGRLPRSKRTREGLDAEVLEDLGETGKRHTPGRGDAGGRGRDGGRDGRREGDRDGGRQRTRRHGSGERAPEGAAADATAAGETPAGGRPAGDRPEGHGEEGTGPRRRRNRRRTRGGRPAGEQGAAAPSEG
ncbi:DEAD/DEAH box helicase [Cellulomonas sp. C5510]|uniref:DEAD/DEAH box helicase n=1 Tax=Cellulomonas sp. C5510 TaxID=2871170 RepID=UPI001C95135F|nr:DEAD/DEAH box helicase [Cellulomonas sp. C5510]